MTPPRLALLLSSLWILVGCAAVLEPEEPFGSPPGATRASLRPGSASERAPSMVWPRHSEALRRSPRWLVAIDRRDPASPGGQPTGVSGLVDSLDSLEERPWLGSSARVPEASGSASGDLRGPHDTTRPVGALLREQAAPPAS